jgi:hypothetical protein
MTFFYDLNKRLAALAKKQDATQIAESKQADHVAQSPLAQALNEAKADTIYVQHSNGAPQKVKLTPDMKAAGKIYVQHPSGPQTKVKMPADAKKSVKEEDVAEAGYSAKAGRAGKDLGKPGKMFSKIAKSAGKAYGSKAAGERVAGAVLNKLRGKTNEGDMEEGNEFSGELIKARAQGAKEFKVDGKSYPVKEGAKPDYIDLDKDGNKKESMKKAAADKKKSKSAGTAFDPETAKSMFANKDKHPRYDVKDTGYSKIYTRKIEEPSDDDDTDAPANKGGEPGVRKKGRPKGKDKGPERVTAKSYKYKAGRPAKTQEDLDSDGVMMTRPSNMSSEDIESISLINKGEYDREGDMAKDDLESLAMAAKELHGILGDDENLPEWVQSKITKALDYINSSNQYMHQQKDDQEPVAEKAVSKQQQKFMGMAHAMQKGEKIKGASPELKKVAKTMKKSDVTDFAATKHKGLPKKAKTEAEVEETADAPTEKKSKGGYNFGAGVYESYNKQFTKLLTESMNINVSMSSGQNGEPTKSITVSAEGEDAEALAALLKMAGIGGQDKGCNTCGTSPCGCESLDENSPDWPTNTETSDDALQYSGGLNGPKSTGQTTVPVVASQERRLHAESVELERSLFKLYKEFK